MWVLSPLQAGPSGGGEASPAVPHFPKTRGQGWRCCWSAGWLTQLGSAGPSPQSLVVLCPTHTCRCGGSTCLGAMGRLGHPPVPLLITGGWPPGSCRKPDSRDPEGRRHVWTWEGPAQVNFCLELHLEATGQDCVGQLTVGVRAVAVWGLG